MYREPRALFRILCREMKFMDIVDKLKARNETANSINNIITALKADGLIKTGDVSDTYHTFDELYNHRTALFLALCRAYPEDSWWSSFHDDGTMFDEMFIAGINLPSGPITYHIEDYYRPLFAKYVKEVDKAPKWDGHTPQDVVIRLLGGRDQFINDVMGRANGKM